MKTKFTCVIVILGFMATGCDKEKQVEPENPSVDLINDQFAGAQAEVREVLDGIFGSIQEKDADKLISNHIYGEKFTEFRDSERRTGGAENEQYERGFVGAISAFEYELEDLKIDVFGDVAIATFHADFRPTIGEDTLQIWGSVTLVLVKIGDTWKITHEHFSPLNV